MSTQHLTRLRSIFFAFPRNSLAALVTVGCIAAAQVATAQIPLETILKIERGGKGIASASEAAGQLVLSGVKLETVLSKAKGANPVAKNWILSIAQSMTDKMGDAAMPLLERVLADKSADGEVRYWALDRLASGDKAKRKLLLDGRTEDPSLDIRYEAIEQVIQAQPKSDSIKDNEAEKKRVLAIYQTLLGSARLADQVNGIAARMKELEVEVDLRKHFGFVSQWQVIGPFDNRKEIGFNQAYAPESEYLQSGKLDSKSKYPGKMAEVSWQPAATDKVDGQVDLNPVFNNEKGAVIYAYTTVDSPSDLECQVRLGSPNANKVWVNGQESTANNVYHTGSQIDQYVVATKLRRGQNTILVKICQNEQTESWAQDLGFKLRFTDETGLAIQVTQ